MASGTVGEVLGLRVRLLSNASAGVCSPSRAAGSVCCARAARVRARCLAWLCDMCTCCLYGHTFVVWPWRWQYEQTPGGAWSGRPSLAARSRCMECAVCHSSRGQSRIRSCQCNFSNAATCRVGRRGRKGAGRSVMGHAVGAVGLGGPVPMSVGPPPSSVWCVSAGRPCAPMPLAALAAACAARMVAVSSSSVLASSSPIGAHSCGCSAAASFLAALASYSGAATLT